MGSAARKVSGAIGGSVLGGAVMGPLGAWSGGLLGSKGGSAKFSQMALNRLSPAQSAAARDADIKAGTEFANSVLPKGSLSRLKRDKNVIAGMDVLRNQLQGFSAPELQAQRDQATSRIQGSTESSRRRLAAAQAQLGLRGATAAKQQSDVITKGIQEGQVFERDLLLNQRNAQTEAAQNLLGQAKDIQKFDLGLAAKEKFAKLSTGLGFAQIGSAERSGVSAGNAAVQAAQAQAPSGGLLGGILGK